VKRIMISINTATINLKAGPLSLKTINRLKSNSDGLLFLDIGLALKLHGIAPE
jgi:hypothetical protein